MTTCGWTTYNWLFDEMSKCENDATRTITTGCVHEHLYACPTCDRCAEVTTKRIEDMACTPCRDLGNTDGVKVAIVSDEPLEAVQA